MKAIINKKYGSPDIMELREVARPEPKANEVLVKVLAASVNKADWHTLHGEPFPVRLVTGIFKPKFQTLGADISGIVERVGKNVTQFRKGDEVFGDLSGNGFGGFAEFAVTHEKFLSKKPYNLSFEESSALPMAAVTALQGLRNKGEIGEGDQVLINGASGGVGGFAIQIAKAFGADVTAVCSSSKADIARNHGADRIIEYDKEDFTKREKSYDLIFDVIGNHPVQFLEQVMKKGGRYVSCAFSMEVMFFGPWKSIIQNKKLTNLIASSNQADLQFISKLAEIGSLVPHIQQTFTLDDVPEAMKIIGKGSASGKLVITI